jgi:hypothetical protein
MIGKLSFRAEMPKAGYTDILRLGIIYVLFLTSYDIGLKFREQSCSLTALLLRPRTARLRPPRDRSITHMSTSNISL